MAKPKRSRIERESDLAKIAELYLNGQKQSDIAIQLEVSQQQISYDLKELQKRWAASSVRNLDAAKGEELEKIDNLERTYWEAWRKSRGKVKTTSTEHEKIVFDENNKMSKMGPTDPKSDGTLIKTVTRTERKVGEGRYLDGVQWCIERRCKILGIDAPAKTALTDPSGDKEYGGLNSITDTTAIDRIATLFNAARARRDNEPPQED